MTRFIKQILYGILYCIVFVSVGFVFYKVVIIPSAFSCFDGKMNGTESGVDCGGDCNSCASKAEESLRVSEKPEVFGTESGRAFILFEVTNPNSYFHASRMNYSIDVYGVSGYVIETVSGNDAVLASERRLVYVDGIKTLLKNIDKIKINLGEISWQATKEVILPEISVLQNIETIIENGAPKVTGFIKNQSSLSAKETGIIAILKDSLGEKVFPGQTLISNIAPFEERQFTILFPRDEYISKNTDIKATEVFAYGK